jgi:hypothetical protein
VKERTWNLSALVPAAKPSGRTCGIDAFGTEALLVPELRSLN